MPDVTENQSPLDLLSRGFRLSGDSPWKWNLQIQSGDLVGRREMDGQMVVMSEEEVNGIMAALAERSAQS